MTASCCLNISQVVLGISRSAHLFAQVVPMMRVGVVMCSIVDDLWMDSSSCLGVARIVSSLYFDFVGIAYVGSELSMVLTAIASAGSLMSLTIIIPAYVELSNRNEG